MGRLGFAMARPKATLVGQLAISVTATIVASLILAGLQQGLMVFRGVPPHPELTSGGKFAARVEALRVADDTPPAQMFPVRVPLLVANAGFAPVPLPSSLRQDAALGAKPAAEPFRPSRRVARAEPRHRALADTSLDVPPPRRSDNVPVAESPVGSEAVRSEGSSMWATTKGLYRQAVWIGGTVLDRVNPANLLP